MTLTLVVLLCAGVVALALLLTCRGRRHHPGDRWNADVNSYRQANDHVKQVLSPTSMNGRKPL